MVGRTPFGNQSEFTQALAARGFQVTQAMVSREIAELGLVRVVRQDRHLYAAQRTWGRSATGDRSLRRILRDLPVQLRRSGLTLLLVSSPDSGNAIAEAIDRSSLRKQEGTVAGDDAVLVLFGDEERLLRWHQGGRSTKGWS